MIVKVHSRAFAETRWFEYAIRFVLGGLVTVAAGVIAQKYGAALGGLFLAFPAIFPASATLIEKHERQKKEQQGMEGTCGARAAAGADAFGASMGSMGLLAFALFTWKMLPSHSAVATIAAATLVWWLVSLGIWLAWKKNLLRVLRRYRRRDKGDTLAGVSTTKLR